MNEIIYFFKRIWYYYILNTAYYITFDYSGFYLGEIIETTYGGKMEVLSKPKINGKYYKYLIINK